MPSKLFEDLDKPEVQSKIRKRLPELFQMAEIESSRANKIGMEVGSLREKILIAYMIYRYGENNVDINVPITQAEVDTRLFGCPISIKTKSNSGFSGVKLIWTVDAENAKQFLRTYKPSCDLLFAHINWEHKGGLYYIPKEIQLKHFAVFGREAYIKLPPEGKNPRGVEIKAAALRALVNDERTKVIDILWKRSEIDYDPYERWVDFWKDA